MKHQLLRIVSNQATFTRFSNRSFSVFRQIDPASGKVIKEFEEDSPQRVREKFNSAKNAQKEWENVPLDQKKKAIEKYAEILQKNTEDLAKLLTEEMGKPISQATNEIKGVIPRLQFFIKNIDAVLAPRIARMQPLEEVRWEALGTIANISAWNYPWFIGTNVYIPALLTGNTVLYKPSEYVARSGLKMAHLLWEAGIPRNVFVPVIGSGSTAEALLDCPIDGVFFTGSNRTGMKIAQKMAGRMVKVQLELGGKDPTFVASDVNLDKAVDSLVDGAFYNTGQGCCSVERIYVAKEIYPEFIQKYVEGVKNFKIGDPKDPSTYIGPLTLPNQPKLLLQQVQDAKEKGAKVLIGGNIPNKEGHWFEPTVLTNTSQEMEVIKEESFGPIVAIQAVSNEEEAIKLMNDTKYGLTASIYTTSKQRAERMMKELNAGTVYWNACDRVSPFLPWTGRKGSGIGSTLGLEGIQSFIKPKAYHLIGN